MIWLTADEHHAHRNIIRHCNRPFKNIVEMRKTITKEANNVLKKGDELWHVGDYIWYGPEKRHYYEETFAMYLEGVTHHLVLGNHDRANPFFYVETGFTTVHTAVSLTIGGITYVLAHDPSAYCAVGNKAVLLCAHIHTLFKVLPKERVINVGVDQWNFRPVSMEEIQKILP